jgi:hypothetical protein
VPTLEQLRPQYFHSERPKSARSSGFPDEAHKSVTQGGPRLLRRVKACQPVLPHPGKRPRGKNGTAKVRLSTCRLELPDVALMPAAQTKEPAADKKRPQKGNLAAVLTFQPIKERLCPTAKLLHFRVSQQ